MNPEYTKLVVYVNAATDLAESIQADMKSRNRKVSSSTVEKLGKFITAAHTIQKMIDQVEADRVQLN